MEREERIKELARRINNALLECDDFTYEDMACSITFLVGVVDSLCEKERFTKSGSFAKYVHDMIGDVYKVSSDKQEWRPSTEHPAIDEEVIALVGENKMISFAHIVDKRGEWWVRNYVSDDFDDNVLYGWKCCVAYYDLKIWAYTDDLLPKGGEK